MGLDMYAYSVDRNAVINDFEFDQTDKPVEIFYWRKEYDLHDLMFEVYVAKGGVDDRENFNLQPIRLEMDDLNGLLGGVDSEFIEIAKREIKNGRAVYYDSWW